MDAASMSLNAFCVSGPSATASVLSVRGGFGDTGDACEHPRTRRTGAGDADGFGVGTGVGRGLGGDVGTGLGGSVSAAVSGILLQFCARTFFFHRGAGRTNMKNIDRVYCTIVFMCWKHLISSVLQCFFFGPGP